MTFVKAQLENVFGADLRSLAAMRIACALLIIVDLLQRSTDLVAHYSDFGVVPRTTVIEHSSSRWFVSFHLMSGTWEVQAMLFLLGAVCAFGLLAGYRTRLFSILSWAFFISLCARNPFILQGGDVLFRVVLFWGMFLPWGACYSVDSAWNPSSDKLPKSCLSWGAAAYAIQIVFVYWFTVTLKSGAQWWSEGSAVYYAMSIDYLVTPLGRLLLDLPAPVLKLTTWGVLLFEIVGPLALLWPVKTGVIRTIAVFCFWGLHLAFLLTLLIGTFPIVNMIAMIFFLPPSFWDSIMEGLKSPERTGLKIYYDQDCGFCSRSVRLIRTFFLLPEAEVTGAQTVAAIEADMKLHNSWVVIDAAGAKQFRYDAAISIAGASPVLWPLAPILKLSAVRWVGERIYAYVSNHRATSCRLIIETPTAPDLKLRSSFVANLAIVSLITYVFVWNLANIPELGFRIPERVRSVGNILGLDQVWNMFAPFPAKDDGWYVIPGTLKSGSVVDLFRDGKEISLQKPAFISLTYKNHRWRKYIELMRKRDFLQPVFAHYLCRDWNRRHRGGEALQDLEIIFFLEWTQPHYQYSPVEKMSVFKHRCAS